MPHKWDSGQIASRIFASVILTLCEFNDCCNKRILKLQPDFIKQKSLVQETTKAAGHLCLFLPKFHCELNPIEYFWGMVKNISVTTVITCLRDSRINWKHWNWCRYRPFNDGKIGFFIGWRLIAWVWDQLRHMHMSRSTHSDSLHPIDMFQRELKLLLADVWAL